MWKTKVWCTRPTRPCPLAHTRPAPLPFCGFGLVARVLYRVAGLRRLSCKGHVWRTVIMKRLALACAVCLVASSAFATLTRDEVKRLHDAATILTELRNTPDKGIPEELWNKAQCVIVIPGLKKAAFVVGGEYGSGVMSCRSKDWSAPVFMQLAKGSWGFQIGAEEVDLVLLVMNRRGVDKLLDDKVSLGADASVAAGPVGRAANASTDAKLSAEMLSYSRSKGVFAG